VPCKPLGPLAMTLQGAQVAIEDGAGVDGLRLSVEDPNSSVDAADTVEFM